MKCGWAVKPKSLRQLLPESGHIKYEQPGRRTACPDRRGGRATLWKPRADAIAQQNQPCSSHLDQPHRLNCCHSSSLEAASEETRVLLKAHSLHTLATSPTQTRTSCGPAERFSLSPVDVLNVNMQKIPETPSFSASDTGCMTAQLIFSANQECV